MSKKPWETENATPEADSPPDAFELVTTYEKEKAKTDEPPETNNVDQGMLQMLTDWAVSKKTLEHAKQHELELRSAIRTYFFPKPKEGTQHFELPDGWKLTLQQGLDRKVDEAVMDAVFKEMPEGSKDKLIKMEPKLIVKPYKALDEKTKAIFEQLLIIKKSSPQMKLVAPKPKEVEK